MAQGDRGRKTRTPGVYRQKDGKWLVQVVVRQDGKFKQRQLTLPAETPEAQVVAARASLRLEAEYAKEAEPVRPESPPRTTVASYSKLWIVRKKTDWRPKTVKDNVQVLSERVLPVVGEVPVEDLKRAHIMGWRTWAEGQRMANKSPYSSATLSLWWRVFRSLLNDIIVDHDLSTTLTFKVKPPGSVKGRVRTEAALTVQQLRELLALVRDQHPAWYAEVYTLAFSGMRPGELYALSWTDADLDGGRLNITKSVVQGNVGRPKSGKARIVALTDGMTDVLRAHRASRPESPNGLVFPSETGGYRSDTTMHHLLAECGTAAGIPFRVGPQVLRYTANTLLREAGVADEIVRDRLGHATREMGFRYFKGHIEAQKAAVERLQTAVEGGAGR
jgi:integrase